VTALNGDRAQVLVLADQAAKTAAGQSEVGTAHLDLIAELRNSHWKIASIEIL
jgi:Mce-associated membrane protein